MVVESTYGNRTHPALSVLDQLEGVLLRTFERRGVLVVPAFAVGRVQQMLVLMHTLVEQGRLRAFPIHVDSPMAIEATRIYGAHPEGSIAGLSSIGGRSQFVNKWVTVHRTRQESEALNSFKGPGVIISSSGMLSGGRILHHCRQRLPRPENLLLITGYQAENTLGRALLDGAKSVRIHKGEVPVRAEVANLKGLSGHADAREMVHWLSAVDAAPRRVFLTHGEELAAVALGALLERERGFPTYVPSADESVEL
jgi:metallo-beta-lactamase family protein